MNQLQFLQDEQTLLWAIAASSFTSYSTTNRQKAFYVLEEFKQNANRIQNCLQWLQRERVIYNDEDVTLAAKLFSLEVVATFLSKGGYGLLSDVDRSAIRLAVLRSARTLAIANVNAEDVPSLKILAKKIAAVLEDLVLRDFPQRWASLATDLFASVQEGGLWYTGSEVQELHHIGVIICLECLKLIAEDCTDADFNSKISTQRRSDVLVGLNDISHSFLPLIYKLLESHSILHQAKSSLFSMHSYLMQKDRNIATLTTDEAAMYKHETTVREGTAAMIASALDTLEKFCSSMPVKWILGDSLQPIQSPDFCTAVMYLLRERDSVIQIRAANCLEQLCIRGKLEYSSWMRFIRDLPEAIRETDQAFLTEFEQLKAESEATGGINQKHHNDNDPKLNPLSLQLEFHRTLGRVLANIVASNIAHITLSNGIVNRKEPDYGFFIDFLKLLVYFLRHPSGRIVSEELGMWISLLRDPQIVKEEILDPFLDDVLVCFMDHSVKIRWEDVENKTHPFAQLLETTFDDEEDYDAWLGDFRSRSSLLFKLIGNVGPHIAARVLNARVQNLINHHGDGRPLNFLEITNEQLTLKSDAVIIFEGIVHPLESLLNGLPSWALESDSTTHTDRQKFEKNAITRSSIAELAYAIVTWNPSFIWLKFRKAQLLESIKQYWNFEPSTLLQAVDCLLQNLGLPDIWNQMQHLGGPSMSGEMISLKKKSGTTLVAIAKKVPQHLVPWLSKLSEVTSSLLASDGLVPLNQTHLYEFLTCVASAVDDPTARSNFIGEVLLNGIKILESHDIQQHISSVSSLLNMLGVIQAREQPGFVVDPLNVKVVTSKYHRLFTVLNRLLAVGRRCNEAARKRKRETSNSATSSGTSFYDSTGDDHAVSIHQLAVEDPFVPLWPRILPHVMNIYEIVLGVWRPQYQALLLQDDTQRYVYAISDDEVFIIKNHVGKSGGVFGEGGTAGSIVFGTDRRDANLVPRWSGWLNELRNCCFQLLGLLAAQRAWFSPELSDYCPRLLAIVADPTNLRAMEHRHITQFLKHIVELLLFSCPVTMYPSHLAPVLTSICEHMRYRLNLSWRVVLQKEPNSDIISSTKALVSSETKRAAILASKDENVWFSWYYAHSGLFVGDLDAGTSEAAVDKYRVEIGRTYSDVLQSALALKGDWALVLANEAKESNSVKQANESISSMAPSNHIKEENIGINTDDSSKIFDQASIDDQKLRRIDALCHFLFLENEQIAGQLTLTIIDCLGYPDAYTCRRFTKICHRLLETVAWAPQYSKLLGLEMFSQAVKNIVIEPKWMVGMEWDVINVIRDIYCRLVLGQILQFGGQGPGQEHNYVNGTTSYEQSKSFDKPRLGGGILTSPSPYPRQVLERLPGITSSLIDEFENAMRAKRSAKDQKDLIRDLLRVVADNLQSDQGKNGPASVFFDKVMKEESLLNNKCRPRSVPDLPEKFIRATQKQPILQNDIALLPEEGLSAFNL